MTNVRHRSLIVLAVIASIILVIQVTVGLVRAAEYLAMIFILASLVGGTRPTRNLYGSGGFWNGGGNNNSGSSDPNQQRW